MLDDLLPLNGRCTCGEIKYQMLNKPLIVHCCHCTYCQRETGASFALNAFIESKYVKLLQGNPETINTPTDSGDGQKIIRCPTCKIAVWGHYTGAGDAISFVRIGTLDDPNVLQPDIHVYTSTKQDWLMLSEDVPQREEYYDKLDYWPAESIERFNSVKGN